MNLRKLNGKIAEAEIKRKELADRFGISVQAMGKKLNGTTKITVDDALLFCDVLKIHNNNDKVDIFLR